MKRSFQIAVLLLAVASLAAVTAASALASPTRKAADSLTVEVPFPLTNFAAVFVAQGAGLFKKYGVDVTIKESTGATTNNNIVTGDADLAIFATTNPLLIAAQGKQTTSIYNFSRDPGAFLLAKTGITTVQQLAALGDKCHIVTSSVGSQSYGYAVQYKNMAKLGLGQCTLENTGSTGIELARFATNDIQAAVGPYSFYALAKQAQPTNVLINPNLPSYRKQYNLPNFCSGTVFGLRDNLAAKRSAVVKFLKAYDIATKMVVPKNLTLVTNYLQPFDSFKVNDFKTNRTSLQYTILSIGASANLAPPDQVKKSPDKLVNDPGFLSAANWNLSLQQYAKWGVPNLDITQPFAQYSQSVDMSYLADALKIK